MGSSGKWRRVLILWNKLLQICEFEAETVMWDCRMYRHQDWDWSVSADQWDSMSIRIVAIIDSLLLEVLYAL